MGEVYVRVISLPSTIRGVTVRDENGDYNVYINARLPVNKQKETLKHEMTHIDRNDFDRFDDIFDIEDIDA